jgi:phosphoserine phosphatase
VSPRPAGGRRYASVVIDVDSTLSGVEGIDWLAGQRGESFARRIAALTERAMNGELTLDAVYGERLALIRPRREEVEALAVVYRQAIAPGAAAAIAALRGAGVDVVLVSGGLRPAIVPLAHELGVPLHAVDVHWSASGEYEGFDAKSPLTTQDGKRRVIEELRLPRPLLAVGDGSTDAAMRPSADAFAAFTGFVRRDIIIRTADVELASFDALARHVLG